MSGGRQQRTYTPDFLTELFRSPQDPGYADSAARRAQVGPRTGWRRTGARGAAWLTLVVLGFLLAVAYRQAIAEEPARGQARAVLVDQIKLRQGETDRLQREVAKLGEQVAQMRDAALTGTAAARLRDLEAATGLARVSGDGVVVRVADGPPRLDPVTGAKVTGTNKPDVSKVLDRDLQDVSNALWSAGAEAISINGQRLTATSTIRAAGDAILVDFQPITGPYEVSAIGPDDIDDRFADSGTARLFRRLVDEYGMTFEVQRRDDLVLPGAVGVALRYAAPSPTAGPSTTASANPDSPDNPPTPSSPGPSESEGG